MGAMIPGPPQALAHPDHTVSAGIGGYFPQRTFVGFGGLVGQGPCPAGCPAPLLRSAQLGQGAWLTSDFEVVPSLFTYNFLHLKIRFQ